MHLNTYRILFDKRFYHQVFRKLPLVYTLLFRELSPSRVLPEFRLRYLSIDAQGILWPSNLHHLISDHWFSPLNFSLKSFWHCIERIYLCSRDFNRANLPSLIVEPRYSNSITTSDSRPHQNFRGSPTPSKDTVLLQFFEPHMWYLTLAVTRMCLLLKPKHPRKG